MKRVLCAVLGSALALAACSPTPPPAPPPARPLPPPAPPLAPKAEVDPLGPKPETPTPEPFTPPAPLVFTGPGGMSVWLVERHSVPLVAMTMVVPYGASSDPAAKPGLAWMAANMLDEGAGKLGSIALAKQLEMLGAQLRTGASLDYSNVSLSVIKRNLAPAFALFADVVARPRFEEREWKRVHDLWVNDLASRTREPDVVARVASMRALYGDASPYGHPVDGYLASPKAVALGDVRAFYKDTWRPDAATLVIVGDVTRAELEPLFASSWADWKTPKATKPAAPTVAAPLPPAAKSGPFPRISLVDRPDAPQSVIALVRGARAAAEEPAAVLTRVNIALGGSFTSRLNQDLREEHGWSYGASSRVTLLRASGSVVAQAAVQTEHTGEALAALVKDVGAFAKEGLSEDEARKTRLMARTELVSLFETVESTAMRLARDAALGLGPDYEAKASVRRDTAPPDALAAATRDFDPSSGLIIVVGPRSKLESQLSAIGVDAFDVRDAEGKLVKPAGK